MEPELAPFAASRDVKGITYACGLLLAGLQHIVDWKCENQAHPDHFRYTLGALIHALEGLDHSEQLIVISYFHVYTRSMLEGERIKFRSHNRLHRFFSKRMYQRRVTLCAQLLDFISGSLAVSHHEAPSNSGPFPRLDSMKMPIFRDRQSEAQTEMYTAEQIERARTRSSGTDMEPSRVLQLVFKWLHGRGIAKERGMWVTDKIFNEEIRELSRVLGRWTRLGLSNK